ncbi:hypothetical protein V3390_03040 [Luteimonas sp. FXH3W]|uniref:Uncharacterized protein n=1 Tax=Aquilutibacter rugosus TaxID=3115820 RepID=A0ABU7UZ15_9GAMM
MGHPQLSHQLAETFLSAPFEENGWETALGALAKPTHSTQGKLITVGDESLIRLNLTTDMDPRFEQDFVAITGGSASGTAGAPCCSRFRTALDPQRRATA